MAQEPDENIPTATTGRETLATLYRLYDPLRRGPNAHLRAVQIITADASPIPSSLAVVVSFISIIGKLLLALYQFRTGRKTKRYADR